MYLLSSVVLVGVILKQALQNRSHIAGGYGSACYSIYRNAAQLGAVAGPGIYISFGNTYHLRDSQLFYTNVLAFLWEPWYTFTIRVSWLL